MSQTADEVLIADEDAICSRRGLVPIVAPNGRASVELIRGRADRIAAVFLDVRMPRLDGVQVLEQLRAISPTLPYCLMTAFHRDRQIMEGLTRCGVSLLHKPFDPAAFAELLDRMLTPPRADQIPRGNAVIAPHWLHPMPSGWRS